MSGSGLLDGCNHVMADVSLVTYPLAGIKRQKNPGFTQAIRIRPVSIDRIGIPCQASGERAGELNIHASGLTPPFWHRGGSRPPASWRVQNRSSALLALVGAVVQGTKAGPLGWGLAAVGVPSAWSLVTTPGDGIGGNLPDPAIRPAIPGSAGAATISAQRARVTGAPARRGP